MHKKTLILPLLALIIIGSLIYFFPLSNNINIIEQKSEKICNTLFDEECSVKYENIKNNPVEKISDHSIKISAEIPACTKLSIKSIKEKSDFITIKLLEEGFSCDSGYELHEIFLEVDKKISLDKLDILLYNQEKRTTEKIYPLE